ncbi:hypothetical protein DSL72_004486 [Monilinia vaccinii-corymbosi]|uniref:Uncharacterized protein n=1 Tax=Monilinia vaccinii-corymbosi TaxID=61207 RepID=A0A8A3P7H5_9HELO|nr:hypothetical protein DSL72_004486 [Monilinia vaccinii-corymbosi]
MSTSKSTEPEGLVELMRESLKELRTISSQLGQQNKAIEELNRATLKNEAVDLAKSSIGESSSCPKTSSDATSNRDKNVTGPSKVEVEFWGNIDNRYFYMEIPRVWINLIKLPSDLRLDLNFGSFEDFETLRSKFLWAKHWKSGSFKITDWFHQAEFVQMITGAARIENLFDMLSQGSPWTTSPDICYTFGPEMGIWAFAKHRYCERLTQSRIQYPGLAFQITFYEVINVIKGWNMQEDFGQWKVGRIHDDEARYWTSDMEPLRQNEEHCLRRCSLTFFFKWRWLIDRDLEWSPEYWTMLLLIPETVTWVGRDNSAYRDGGRYIDRDMLLEIGDKLNTLIGYHGTGQAMELLYVFQEYISNAFSVIGTIAEQEVFHFSQTVNDYKDRIVFRTTK